MLAAVRDLFAGMVLWFYAKVFGKQAGPVSRNFMKNITYVFAGLFVAKLFSLFFQIYVGRTIGAAEYGKYALVFSLSQFLWVPMLMGIGMATVKYLSPEKDGKERKFIISTSVTLVLMLSVLFTLLLYAAAQFIAAPLSMPSVYVQASVFVALSYAVWVYAQEILKGLGKMKVISAMNVVYGVVIVLASVVLLSYSSGGEVAVIAVCVGYLVSSIVLIPVLRGFYRPGINRKWARILLHYGGIAVLGLFSCSLIGNMNQILLNMFMDVESVGLYQAYYLSSVGVVTFFVTILVTVFFPESSRYENKAVIFRQIKKLFILAPVIFVAIGCASYAIVTLYGAGYAMMPELVLLFALATVLLFMYTIYTVFSSSLGIAGIKITTITIAIVSLIGVASSFVLIPVMQIHGAAVSLAVSHAVGLVLIYAMLKRFLSANGASGTSRETARSR